MSLKVIRYKNYGCTMTGGELVEEKLDEKNYPKEIKELLEKRRKLAYPEIEDKKVDVSDLTFEKTNETD